jgi:hypothetical protein
VALSNVKTRDYRQSAVICNVRSERPHLNRAYERFTPEGPLALLPNGNELSLIWTAEHGHAQELATLDDAEFCARLRSTFGAALGGFSAPYSREVFPLTLKYAAQPVASRSVLIGNAAQTLHPVAGQGFNLGLRDAWELAQAIASQGDCDPGNANDVESLLLATTFRSNCHHFIHGFPDPVVFQRQPINVAPARMWTRRIKWYSADEKFPDATHYVQCARLNKKVAGAAFLAAVTRLQ